MAKDKYNWEEIKAEYDLGQLSLEAIAAKHGMPDSSAIRQRKKRHGWGERPEVSEIVREIVRNPPREGYAVTTTPRIALMAFDRVLALLHRHRGQLAALDKVITECFADIARIRKRIQEGYKGKPGRDLNLLEVDGIATIAAKLSQAMSRAIPLERRAFGLNDAEGPSEFDALTQEQLEQLMAVIQERLGRNAIEAKGVTVE